MKKDEIVVGEKYVINHTSGRGIEVKILEKIEIPSYRAGTRSKTHWRALNLKTNHEITIRSLVKFLRKA